MFERKQRLPLMCLLLGLFPSSTHFDSSAAIEPRPEIVFDHIHTYQEVVDYLNEVLGYYSTLTELHTTVCFLANQKIANRQIVNLRS